MWQNCEQCIFFLVRGESYLDNKMSSEAVMVDVSEHIGQWKVVLLLLLGCNYAIVGINHTLPTFQGYTPYYFCQVDNVSVAVEGCVKEPNSFVMQTEQSCPQGYQFKSDRDDWTVVTEWQLVCERRFLRPLIATLYFCGVTIGAVICGLLADRYGRRPLILICLYAQGLAGVSLYFIQSLAAFMALRFIQGFFVQGLQGTTYTLLMELFPPKFRTAVGVVLELYWAFGLVYLAGASYYVPSWRPLELVLSIPTAATLVYVCFFPESARWLAIHGRVEAQKTWKRIIPYNRSDPSNDTNSIKNKSNELKCTGCDIAFQSKNTNRQHTVNNDMIQIQIKSIPVDNADFGYADTGIQLPADRGEDYKGIMKQETVKDKLKRKAEDYSRRCDGSSVGTEHTAVMQDSGDYKSQNSHYLKASDCSTTEVSHLLNCEITNDCSEKINDTYRADYKKKLKLIEGDEVADVTLMHTSTNSQNSSSSMVKGDYDEEFKTEKSCKESKEMLEGCSLHITNSSNDITVDSRAFPCLSGIRKEIGDTQKSNKHLDICRSSSESDFTGKEVAQELGGDEGKSIGVQCMSGTADETRMQCEGSQGACIGSILAADDKIMNAVPAGSMCRMTVVSGEEYETVSGTEVVERNIIVTEDGGTTSDTLCDGVVRMNTSGTVVGHDDGVICSNMPQTCKIIENNTVTDTPAMMETAAKRTGFFELFRSSVLRKYNLIMVFVWFTVSLLYYGIMFHLPDLSGERHLNFLLGAVVEILSYVLAYFILTRFGRRLPMASFLFISGIICVVVGAVSVLPEDAYWIGQTQIALALVGKGVVVSGFCTMFLYASELFPTVLRGAAIGHCGFWGRVGSLLAPQLLFLGEYTLSAVPLVIMGLLGMLAGLSVLALPETLGQQLPDTVEEVEMWVRNRRQL